MSPRSPLRHAEARGAAAPRSTQSAKAPPRLYGGLSAEERQAERRDRLIVAAIQVSALTAFFAVLAEYPGPARVFLVELDETEAEMKALGRAAAARFGALFVPDAEPGSLAQAGATGAIIQIARRWIQEGFKPAPEKVAAICLPFARAAKPQRG